MDRYDLEKLETLKERAEKVQAGMLGVDDDIKTAAKNNKISKDCMVCWIYFSEL